MKSRCLFFLVLLSHSLPVLAIDFEEEVAPILREHCFDCHATDAQEGQLRLDRLSGMLAGGNSGEPAVVPGEPDASYLLKLIRHKVPSKQMPPDESLSPEEISLIEKWIAEGAKTPPSYGPAKELVDLSHWAFQPVRRVDKKGIDPFIRDRLAVDGLAFSEEADRRTLIRRLYLVMHGLPPTPAEVDEFLADRSENAWEVLVEKTLASPHYGQRWATYWLDLVRFGETNGFETNRERPNAWHFRDWVIQSLNADKPYDQFVREQLAGDALGASEATGFLVAGPYDLVKGQDPKLGQMQRMNELDDMINTTGTAFLGLTTGCARCHNHKFDPIRQTDYYAMQAVFAGVRHGDRAMPLSVEKQKAIAELDTSLSELKRKLEKYIPAKQPAMIVLDDSEAKAVLRPVGEALKKNYDESGFGDSKYTWWANKPGEDIVVYSPKAKGKYRVWISWGAGYEAHSTDARYLIRSGESTREIASVNQSFQARGSGIIDSISRWSGLQDAGVHEFSPEDEIILRGGESGSAITADVIVLQPDVTEDAPTPAKRIAVSPQVNEEEILPTQANRIRFVINKTNGAQACIDELEVFSGDKNVALASSGAKANSSGDFVHPLHKLEHINDGQYGNPRSWIVSEASGWIQIDFAKPALIDRIVWGRDRTGKISDRLAIDYRIETQLGDEAWVTVASSADRYPANKMSRQQTYRFDGFAKADAEQGRQWLEEMKARESKRAELAKQTQVYAGSFSQPGATHRLYRGEPDAKRERVAPGGIAVLDAPVMELDSNEQNRRLELANWITRKDNPLTARVIVNRLWQFHFGVGLVDTPSDFGLNGSRPTHPDLLDWLADELIQSGWSLKHIHRILLLSKTWRQSNRPSLKAAQLDASSRLLWRFPPRRLDAEAIRDSVLSVSGVLDLENASGPGFSPFEVQMENVRHYHAKEKYGPEDWRRMIFMTRVRQEREQVFGAFDCPDASMVVPKRSRSTTPIQALNLLNSRFMIQQAELLAKRLSQHDSSEEQIQTTWQLCFQRLPTEEEIADSRAFIQAEGLEQFARAILNSNEFVFIP